MTPAKTAELLSRLDLSEERFLELRRSFDAENGRVLARELAENKTLYQYLLHAARYVPDKAVEQHVVQWFGEHRIEAPKGGSFTSKELAEWIEARMDSCFRAGVELTQGLDDAVLVKGASLRGYLPQYRRYQADVDCYVGSHETAMELLRRLAAQEYVLMGNLLEGGGPNSIFLFGQFRKAHVSIGFHCGFLPMASLQYPVPLEIDLVGRATSCETDYGAIKTPSIEDVIVVQIAHISRHGSLMHRDVNDLFMIFDRYRPDMAYLQDRLAANDLAHVFKAVMAELQRVYGVSPTVQNGGASPKVWARLLRRGRRKSLTGALPVQASVLLRSGQRTGHSISALCEIARLFVSLILTRFTAKESILRKLNRRFWNRLLPRKRRLVVRRSVSEYLAQ